jgi:hypothetical protein
MPQTPAELVPVRCIPRKIKVRKIVEKIGVRADFWKMGSDPNF